MPTEREIEAAAEALARVPLTPKGMCECVWPDDWSRDERQMYRTQATAALTAASQSRAPDQSERVRDIPTCCVTGAVVGDGGACGDCDPCIMGERLVPNSVKRLIAEKNAAIDQTGALADRAEKAEAALAKIAVLDEADGHELTADDARQAVAIASNALGMHPSQIAACDWLSRNSESSNGKY